MIELKRNSNNPILKPNQNNDWEAEAAFNPCVIKENQDFHMLYRAMSSTQKLQGVDIQLSTIGYAESHDGIHFGNNRQLIKPDYAWETYGCEDPRITKLEDTYYIFYTALSTYPFSAEGIKVGIALSKDLKTIDAKHQVTPFNAKAMALFPERIENKMVAVLTAHTDHPPAKIALAFFDKESDLWSPHYWRDWYQALDSHVIPLMRSAQDHIEVGAPPIKTKYGWILIYSYIQNYFSSNKVFGIEAVLLDLNNPQKVIGRTDNLLVPESEYEIQGKVANITFPTGALVNEEELWVYYGAADTTGCIAAIQLKTLLDTLTCQEETRFIPSQQLKEGFKRYNQNPIISPRPEFAWELKGTLNPAAVLADHGVHILYRAFSNDDTSTLGYALSRDGVHIDERPNYPVYIPREPFEKKNHPGYSGCEDPRITRMGDTLYMLYTAYNGDLPRVAMTSIDIHDFVKQHWSWAKPKILSAPGVFDKNACIFPEKIAGEYIILHRIDRCIYIDFVSEDQFQNDSEFLTTEYLLMTPRVEGWDNRKIGMSAPPIKTAKGWLLLYHGVSEPGSVYKVGAALLDLEDPRQVIARTHLPLIEPEMEYEKEGFVHNVVFPCGAIVMNEDVYIYYGGADFVTCVAAMKMDEILKILENS